MIGSSPSAPAHVLLAAHVGSLDAAATPVGEARQHRIAAHQHRDALAGAVDAPLRRRHRHVVGAATSSSVIPSIVRATKNDGPCRPACRAPVVAGDRLAPFEVGEAGRGLGQITGRGQRQPALALAARDLGAHDVDADAGQEAAHRARLAQRADAAEETDEDLLQQVLAIGPGTEQAAQRLVDARRETIPGRQLRLRLAAAQRLDQRDVRIGVARLALQDTECGRRHLPSIVRACRPRIGQEKYVSRIAAPTLRQTVYSQERLAVARALM